MPRPPSDAADRGAELTRELSLARFLGPRYWPTWLLLGLMHVAARLPPPWQRRLGRALGGLLRRFKRREYRIAARNLELCFKDLGAAERQALLARHFEAVGMSFIEMGIGWFTPLERLLERVTVFGREHLDEALARGNAVLRFLRRVHPDERGRKRREVVACEKLLRQRVLELLEDTTGERCLFRERDRAIVAERGKRRWRLGDRVRVRADRIDHLRHRVEFALVEHEGPRPKRAG